MWQLFVRKRDALTRSFFCQPVSFSAVFCLNLITQHGESGILFGWFIRSCLHAVVRLFSHSEATVNSVAEFETQECCSSLIRYSFPLVFVCRSYAADDSMSAAAAVTVTRALTLLTSPWRLPDLRLGQLLSGSPSSSFFHGTMECEAD